MKIPTQVAIYRTKIAPPNEPARFFNLTYGIDLLQKVKFHVSLSPIYLYVHYSASQGLFVFFVELGSGYDRIEKTFYEHEKCGLNEINYFDYSKPPWLAIKKRSSLKEMLKIRYDFGKKNSFQ